jgi:hypothetical protein
MRHDAPCAMRHARMAFLWCALTALRSAHWWCGGQIFPVFVFELFLALLGV